MMRPRRATENRCKRYVFCSRRSGGFLRSLSSVAAIVVYLAGALRTGSRRQQSWCAPDLGCLRGAGAADLGLVCAAREAVARRSPLGQPSNWRKPPLRSVDRLAVDRGRFVFTLRQPGRYQCKYGECAWSDSADFDRRCPAQLRALRFAWCGGDPGLIALLPLICAVGVTVWAATRPRGEEPLGVMVHFAYGSNMRRAVMARTRRPRSRSASRVAEPPFRHYRGRLCIGRAGTHAAVHGVLWRLTPRDRARLDAWENIAGGLYRAEFAGATRWPPLHRARLYCPEAPPARPKAGYMELVIAAALEWQLPPALHCILAALLRSVHAARAAQSGEFGWT